MSITDKWCTMKSKLAGDIQSANFVNNPQYLLHLTNTTHIQIKLFSKGINLMVCIIEKDNHVSHIPYDYVLSNKNPGFFNYGFSYFECVLEAGNYNIVCVSKNDCLIDDFTIQVCVIKNEKFPLGSNTRLNLIRLVLKNFMYMELLYGDWTKDNSKSLIRSQISEEYNE